MLSTQQPVVIICIFCTIFFAACQAPKTTQEEALKPDFVTDTTLTDTDDPAIWVNPNDATQSLILGTDKDDENGGVYAFDLKGKLIEGKQILGLKRPNNIDVAYGLDFGGKLVDIAVFTERGKNSIRVLRLPELEFIDGGGIPVFVEDSLRDPMGLALYENPANGSISAIVSRKTGADGSYLWQYELRDSAGVVAGNLLRKFGAFKGGKEIEAICVDDELGYVYYSDEGVGVHKYYAHPDSSNTELALFANQDFTEDHEGISIYRQPNGKGYILVSDQQANRFHVFSREGSTGKPHEHKRLAIIPVSTDESDGSESNSTAFGNLYPKGFFIAMSANKTFQIYRWEQLEQRIKKSAE